MRRGRDVLRSACRNDDEVEILQLPYTTVVLCVTVTLGHLHEGLPFFFFFLLTNSERYSSTRHRQDFPPQGDSCSGLEELLLREPERLDKHLKGIPLGGLTRWAGKKKSGEKNEETWYMYALYGFTVRTL